MTTTLPLPHADLASPRAALLGQQRSTLFLDGLRGLAALYVVICHAASLLYSRLPTPNEVGFRPQAHWVDWANRLLLAPFWWGDVAVVFFFVLSGFVIHLRFARRLAINAADPAPFGWRSFVYRRARRLYPPLLLALALTFLLDTVGRHFDWSIYLHTTPYPQFNALIHDSLSPGVVGGNLLFLMALCVPYFGSNGPLWSLAYEWWFYMIYPALYRLTRRSIVGATVAVLAGYGATFLTALWPSSAPFVVARKVLMLLPAWWVGALLADVYSGRIRVRFAVLSPLALLVPTGLALQSWFLRHSIDATPNQLDLQHALSHNLMALGFCGVIAACFAVQERYRLTWLEAMRGLGAMSYSLYVTHAPVLILFTGWTLARSADQHLPHTLLPAMGAIALAIGVGWAAHLVVERPFTGRGHASGS